MKDIEKLPWKKMEKQIDLPISDGEKLIESFGTHWIKYVVPTSIYLTLLSTGIMICFFSRNVPIFLVGLSLVTIVHHWFFQKILSQKMIDVIITDKRLIYLEDSLWFSDNMHEVKIERIRAVEAHKNGLLQNVLQYGDLWFDTGGSDAGSGIIPYVPHPHLKTKEIEELMIIK